MDINIQREAKSLQPVTLHEGLWTWSTALWITEDIFTKSHIGHKLHGS